LDFTDAAGLAVPAELDSSARSTPEWFGQDQITLLSISLRAIGDIGAASTS